MNKAKWKERNIPPLERKKFVGNINEAFDALKEEGKITEYHVHELSLGKGRGKTVHGYTVIFRTAAGEADAKDFMYKVVSPDVITFRIRRFLKEKEK